MRRLSLIVILVTLLAGLAAPAARAGAPVGPAESSPSSLTSRPPGFSTDAAQALRIARGQPAVQKLLREHRDASLAPLVWQGWRWEVDVRTKDTPLGEVDVSATGAVMKIWTGVQAKGYLGRGTLDPTFRRPWVWGAFALLFLLPFVDVKRPRRLLHLDLLVLLSFMASWLLLAAAKADAGIWLFYPPLLYLLGRLLYCGLHRRAGRGALVPRLPTAALLIGVVALFGARVALNVTQPGAVLDIGYASVVGADRITHKQELYVDNDQHGDTYGPVNYLAYVPFELAFPYKGQWDSLWAAHAGTIVFDLLTLLGLFVLGRQMRAGPEGRRLGLALAWAWAAFPLTLYGVMDNTNDVLVSMLLVWMLVVFTRPAARGALLGVAAAAKFFPGALLLVVARGRGGEGRRSWLTCVAACVGIFVFAFALYFPAGGVRELWNCTIGYQLGRAPDLSLWAMFDGVRWAQTVLEAFALLLTVAIAVLPGRRTLGQVAALAGAITIAFQLPAGHWFYFYIMWFAPLALVALFSEHGAVSAAAVGAGDGEDADVTELRARPPLALAS
ncbi:MAG TPA: hypothetical protein VI318_05240 [Baekduia sp.]